MYCVKCGNVLRAEQSFCPKCGTPNNASAAPGSAGAYTANAPGTAGAPGMNGAPGMAGGYAPAASMRTNTLVQGALSSLSGLGQDMLLFLGQLGLMLLSFIFAMCRILTVKIELFGEAEKQHVSLFVSAATEEDSAGLRILLIFFYVAAFAVTLLPFFTKKGWKPYNFLAAKVLGGIDLLWLMIFSIALKGKIKEASYGLDIASVHLYWTGWFFLLFTLGFIALSVMLTLNHKKKTGETLFTMLSAGAKKYPAPGGYYPQQNFQPQNGGYYPPQPGVNAQPGGYYPPQPGMNAQPGGYYPPQPAQPQQPQPRPAQAGSYYPTQPGLSNGYYAPQQNAQPQQPAFPQNAQPTQYPTDIRKDN